MSGFLTVKTDKRWYTYFHSLSHEIALTVHKFLIGHFFPSQIYLLESFCNQRSILLYTYLEERYYNAGVAALLSKPLHVVKGHEICIEMQVHHHGSEVHKVFYLKHDIYTKPAFTAMHGPHSLVRIGPGCADRA